MYKLLKINRYIKIDGLYSLFERTYPTDYRYRGESHDFYEVVCVLEGKVGVMADKSVILLSSGQAIIHPPMEFHSIWAEGEGEPKCFIFSFSASEFPKTESRVFSFGTQERTLIENIYSNAVKSIEKDNKYMVSSVKKGKKYTAQRVATDMENLILSLLDESLDDYDMPSSGWVEAFEKINEVLEKNIERDMSVLQIAEAAGMSSAGIQKICNRYAGMGIKEYFNRLKINRALEYMEKGYSSKQISDILGFSNQNYFSTVFKRIIGVSPLNYKKNH